MRLTEIQDEMDYLREHGYNRGLYPGFDSLYDITSLLIGYPLFIAGSPGAGKTEFAMEMCMVMADIYGMHGAIYMGETGDDYDVYGEICSKYKGKPYLKLKASGEINEYAMSDVERYEAETWTDEHFNVVEDNHKDFKNGLTATDFMSI